MSTEAHRLVNNLSGDCRSLVRRAQSLASGSKLPSALLDDLRKAATHVELALDALQHQARDGANGEGPSWIRNRMSGLAKRLAGGAAREESGQESRMAGSIASLRKGDVGSGRAGLAGNSETIAIPDLIGFLQVQSKAGILRVSLEKEVILLHFHDGDLLHAYSNNNPSGCRLGEILVEQGAIKKEALESFLVYFSAKKGKLGEALGEFVTQAQLQKALDRQIQMLFGRLFGGQNARFTFREGEVRGGEDNPRRNVIKLLLESAQMVDEERSAKRRAAEQKEQAQENEPPNPATPRGPMTIKKLNDALRKPRR